MTTRLSSSCQPTGGDGGPPATCWATFTVDGQRGNQKFLVGGLVTLQADDTAAVILQYPELTVSIVIGYASGGQPWTETRSMWGEAGALHVRLEAPDPLEVWHEGRLVPQVVEHETDWWPWSVKRGLEHAVRAMAHDEPFAVSPLEARAVLRTIRAAYASADTGHRIRMAAYEGGDR